MKIHIDKNSPKVKYLTWILVGLLLAGLFHMGQNYKKNKLTRSVVIHLDKMDDYPHINKEVILREMKSSFGIAFDGIPIENLDLVGIEEVINQYDFVKKADVYLDAHDQLNVKVTTRNALVRVYDRIGEHYYIDVEGMKIKSNGDYHARTVVVTGTVGPYAKNEEGQLQNGLQRIFELAWDIKEDEFANRLVEQIQVQDNGEIILIPKLGDDRILFGMVENVENKLKKIKHFYKGGLRYEGWKKSHDIDLRYRGQVTYRQRA